MQHCSIYKNKQKLLLAFVICTLITFSCRKDFLERTPQSQLSPETYFTTEQELKYYTNSFYTMVPSALDIYYNGTALADDEAITNTREEVKGTRILPTSGGGWSWSDLRKINFYLSNSYKCPNESARNKYDGVARFFRAWFYADMVKRFGDVPWYSGVIEANDEKSLMKPRDSRMLVMDSIIADLNFAIKNLPTQKSIDQVTAWTALALKSRICLYEGTWRKYHANDVFGKDSYGKPLTGSREILQESISASNLLMEGGMYSIYKSTMNKAYQELFTAENAIQSEIILARVYDNSVQVFQDVNYRTVTSSYGRPGVSKSLVNSYLMKDGSRFTDINRYDTLQFYAETQNRDPRLSQTIRTPGYIRMGDTRTSVPDFSATISGYQYIKYITEKSQDNSRNTNDMPIFRYAEILLNYAEAKAELGELTQTDLDKSIKLLRDRVGMPNINLLEANGNPDSYLENQYKQVNGANKGIILEIRRERRIELVRENFRYDDLMRWKEGQLLSISFKGMYLPGLGKYDLDHDGTIDLILYEGQKPTQAGPQYYTLSQLVLEKGKEGGYIIANPGEQKSWDENKDYLYPIPIQELLLNPGLVQNPGWK